jgi:ankyrin repeat protein
LAVGYSRSPIGADRFRIPHLLFAMTPSLPADASATPPRSIALRNALEAAARGEALRPDSLGQTPLALAAMAGDEEALALLLPASELETTSLVSGLSPLGDALRRGQFGAARFLAEAGADCAALSLDGEPLLLRATGMGPEALAFLLARLDPTQINEPDRRGRTALMAAAEKRPELLDTLLAAGASVAARDADGEDALTKAARAGKTKAVDALLPLLRETQDFPVRAARAFCAAAKEGLDAVAKKFFYLADEREVRRLQPTAWPGEPRVKPPLLIQSFLDHAELQRRKAREAAAPSAAALAKQSADEQAALRSAALEGDAARVRLALEKGVLCAPDSLGHTPLILAAKRGATECVQLLLPASDPDACCFNGLNAWGMAMSADHEAAAAILAPKTDFSALNAEGLTPLMVAASHGNGRWVARAAELSGPWADLRSPGGQSALAIAVSKRAPMAAIHPLLRVCDPAKANHGGKSLFANAMAMRGDQPTKKAIWRVLLRVCDPRQVDSYGMNALMHAVAMGDDPAHASVTLMEPFAEIVPGATRRRWMRHKSREAFPRLWAAEERDQLLRSTAPGPSAGKNGASAPARSGAQTPPPRDEAPQRRKPRSL